MMRRLPLFLAVSFLSAATLASAAEPPQANQPILSAPPAGSDLPDLGSPAATILSLSDEYRLGATVGTFSTS